MSTLSSSSTLAEIKAAYADNASYEEDASTAKAAAFVTACRLLLIRLPKRSNLGGKSGYEVESIDPAELRNEMAAAKQWLAVNRTSGVYGRTKELSFTGFRR